MRNELTLIRDMERILPRSRRKFVPGETPLRIAQPLFDREDIRLFVESSVEMFETSWIGIGHYTHEFEEAFSSRFGGRKALFVNSGTSANYLALSSVTAAMAGVAGGNCLTTALTFPSTINPVIASGLKPRLLDIGLPSYSVDMDEVEGAVDGKTRGIVVPHILGLPQPAAELRNLANRLSVFFIEDVCDAIGGSYRGRPLGSYGDPSTFSFYAAHQITTGEGGMLLTSDKEIYSRARSLRDWGKTVTEDEGEYAIRKLEHRRTSRLPADYDARFIFETKGFNLKPIDIQAALGISQLRKLDQFTRRRRENFNSLADGLRDRGADDSLIIAEPIAGSDVSWFGFPLVVEKGLKRGRVVSHLESRNIETRPILAGNIEDQPAYSRSDFTRASKLTNTERVTRDGFFVGLHPALGSEEMDYIAGQLSIAVKL